MGGKDKWGQSRIKLAAEFGSDPIYLPPNSYIILRRCWQRNRRRPSGLQLRLRLQL